MSPKDSAKPILAETGGARVEGRNWPVLAGVSLDQTWQVAVELMERHYRDSSGRDGFRMALFKTQGSTCSRRSGLPSAGEEQKTSMPKYILLGSCRIVQESQSLAVPQIHFWPKRYCGWPGKPAESGSANVRGWVTGFTRAARETMRPLLDQTPISRKVHHHKFHSPFNPQLLSNWLLCVLFSPLEELKIEMIV